MGEEGRGKRQGERERDKPTEVTDYKAAGILTGELETNTCHWLATSETSWGWCYIPRIPD